MSLIDYFILQTYKGNAAVLITKKTRKKMKEVDPGNPKNTTFIITIAQNCCIYKHGELIIIK